jgi:hypothetical protein
MMSKLAAPLVLTAVLLMGAASVAEAACGSATAEFEAVIASDVATGNLNKGVHRRIVADLNGVKATCNAGRDADASRALAATKSRYGYR